MKVLRIILLILFCIIGFLCTQWARSVYIKILEPTTIDCEDGICGPLEEYKDE